MNESTDNRYNGWSNYATWRINLELVEGIDWIGIGNFESMYSLSEYIKEHCEDIITESNIMQVSEGFENRNNFAVDYALAFMNDVNWYEIAEAVNESYNNVDDNDGNTGVLVGELIKE